MERGLAECAGGAARDARWAGPPTTARAGAALLEQAGRPLTPQAAGRGRGRWLQAIRHWSHLDGARIPGFYDAVPAPRRGAAPL